MLGIQILLGVGIMACWLTLRQKKHTQSGMELRLKEVLTELRDTHSKESKSNREEWQKMGHQMHTAILQRMTEIATLQKQHLPPNLQQHKQKRMERIHLFVIQI